MNNGLPPGDGRCAGQEGNGRRRGLHRSEGRGKDASRGEEGDPASALRRREGLTCPLGEGSVIAEKPKAGTNVDYGSKVALVVSKG
jgi:hypothetical protein